MTKDIKFNFSFNHFFMMVIFIIGFILFHTSWNIDTQLQEKTSCDSKILKTHNKIVLCLGLTLIISSLSFFTCSTYSDKTFSDLSLEIYVGSIAVLGLFLIYFGIQISSSATGGCSVTGGSTVWLLGLFILFSSIYYFYRKLKINKV
jgi:magnesium-transporting ATPase (P-type)